MAKQDNYYSFTIPFDYITGFDSDGEPEYDSADMEIELNWNASEDGYDMSVDVPEMYKIDQSINGDMEEIYQEDVYWELKDIISGYGIDFTDFVNAGEL